MISILILSFLYFRFLKIFCKIYEKNKTLQKFNFSLFKILNLSFNDLSSIIISIHIIIHLTQVSIVHY